MSEKSIGAADVTPRESVSSANEICRMDAVTLAEKIRTRQLSPTEVTDAVIARMEKLNPLLGAFCTPTPDVARQEAKAVEADIMAGRPVGPLAGVPVGIKTWSRRRALGRRRAHSSTKISFRQKTMS